MCKPITITQKHMQAGQDVEQHLRMYGYLPALGCCEHDVKFLVYAMEAGEVGGCLECARQLIKQNDLAG